MKQSLMQNKWLDLSTINAETPETLGLAIRRLAVLAAAVHRAQAVGGAELMDSDTATPLLDGARA